MEEKSGISRSDWLGIVGIVIGIVGIIAGYIFYQLSLAEREPVFLGIRASLINKEFLKDTSIRIIRTDGTPIQGDVSILRLFFWNKGKAPIKGSDIYPNDPLTLSLQGNVEILDKKVLTVSRPKIINPVLNVSSRTPSRDVQISFDVLEENDGFSIQIIYTGSFETNYTLSGSILGVKYITNSFPDSGAHEWTAVGIFWLMALFTAAVLFRLSPKRFRTEHLQGLTFEEFASEPTKLERLLESHRILYLKSFTTTLILLIIMAIATTYNRVVNKEPSLWDIESVPTEIR